MIKMIPSTSRSYLNPDSHNRYIFILQSQDRIVTRSRSILGIDRSKDVNVVFDGYEGDVVDSISTPVYPEQQDIYRDRVDDFSISVEIDSFDDQDDEKHTSILILPTDTYLCNNLTSRWVQLLGLRLYQCCKH